MTDDEWDEVEKNIPDHMTIRTYKVALSILMLAERYDLSLGRPFKNKKKGNAIWYVLTDGSLLNEGKGINRQQVTVVLCTPYGIFIEDNYRTKALSFGVLSDADIFIMEMVDRNMRCLTDEERKLFNKGAL